MLMNVVTTVASVEFREIANYLIEKGKFNESLTYYGKALVIDPENEYEVRGKAAALTFLRRYNEALGYFDRALVMNSLYIYVTCQ